REGKTADEQAHLWQSVQEHSARGGGGPDDRRVRAQGLPPRRRANLPAACELQRERTAGPGGRGAGADGGSSAPRVRAIRNSARARGGAARPAPSASALATAVGSG